MRRLELLAPQPAHVQVGAREAAPMGRAFARRAYAIAEALFDGSDDPARLAWTVDDFCDFAARAGRGRYVFQLSVLALTWLAPLFVWRMGPLEALEIELRARALERVEASPVGFLALAPKAILCMIWFEHGERACSR